MVHDRTPLLRRDRPTRMSEPTPSPPQDPTRRRVLQGGAALAAASLLPGCAGDAAPRKQPNVLFVLSDSHRAESAGCYGNPVVRTPSLDAFAAQGLRLGNAVSNTPICRPYRASLMSGRYCHRTGQLANSGEHNTFVDDRQRWRPGDVPLLGHAFTDAGYRCGYFGKWHLGPGQVAPGVDRLGFDAGWTTSLWPTHEYYEWTYARAPGDLIEGGGYFRPIFETDLALEFIDQQSRDTPWFCFLSWGAPHDPFDPPEELRHYGRVKLPPNLPTDESRRYARLNLPLYYGMIEGVDREFGRLMQALETQGLAEDTLVVYTSDHGIMVGGHGLTGKEVPFSESTHVPLLMRWPGKLAAGASDDTLIGAPDLFPTLCGLAGLAPPADVDGLDLSERLRGRDTAPERDAVYLAGHVGNLVPYPGWRGLRTKQHLYVARPEGPWLLFDRERDPWEMKNLVDKGGALVDEMDARLKQTMDEVGGVWG